MNDYETPDPCSRGDISNLALASVIACTHGPTHLAGSEVAALGCGVYVGVGFSWRWRNRILCNNGSSESGKLDCEANLCL